MFSNDIRNYRPVARTMSDAFGPYAKLHVPRRQKGSLKLAAQVIGFGVGIGVFWYVVVLIKVSL